MFRYGGPIKEGVMNGIREPKRNGGSMTQRVQPSNDGSRPGYAGPLIPIGMGIAAGARAIAPAVVRYGKPLLQGAKRIFGKTTPASVTKGAKFNRAQSVKEFGKGSGKATGVTMNPSKFDPNYLGRDPFVRSVGAIGKGIFSPTTGGVVAKAARFATAPSSIVAGVAYYMWPDGEERKNPPPKKTDGVNTPSGNNPFGYEDDVKTTPEGEKELTLAEREALEAKSRMDQMDKYREIIDIKGMNKDAAYKSLIDASKIIQEGGNLKKSLKDGSLISKVTAAASKRFDKVSDTENALRSLVVKGEIDNELNKVDKDLKRQALRGQIKVNEKALAGLTTGEMIQKILGRAQGEYPKGDALRQIISINNPQLNAKVLPTGDMPTGADALEYAVSMINTRNNDETTPDYPEGVYVIKDRVIQVIDGQVIPVPINKL
jgi:hypothetical protein